MPPSGRPPWLGGAAREGAALSGMGGRDTGTGRSAAVPGGRVLVDGLGRVADVGWLGRLAGVGWAVGRVDGDGWVVGRGDVLGWVVGCGRGVWVGDVGCDDGAGEVGRVDGCAGVGRGVLPVGWGRSLGSLVGRDGVGEGCGV